MLSNAAFSSSIQAPPRWPPGQAEFSVCPCGGFARWGACKDPRGHDMRLTRKTFAAAVAAKANPQSGLRIGVFVLRMPWRRRPRQ